VAPNVLKHGGRLATRKLNPAQILSGIPDTHKDMSSLAFQLPPTAKETLPLAHLLPRSNGAGAVAEPEVTFILPASAFGTADDIAYTVKANLAARWLMSFLVPPGGSVGEPSAADAVSLTSVIAVAQGLTTQLRAEDVPIRPGTYASAQDVPLADIRRFLALLSMRRSKWLARPLAPDPAKEVQITELTGDTDYVLIRTYATLSKLRAVAVWRRGVAYVEHQAWRLCSLSGPAGRLIVKTTSTGGVTNIHGAALVALPAAALCETRPCVPRCV
jgi:hypothetical protein